MKRLEWLVVRLLDQLLLEWLVMRWLLLVLLVWLLEWLLLLLLEWLGARLLLERLLERQGLGQGLVYGLGCW